jgi:hypothetical protein
MVTTGRLRMEAKAITQKAVMNGAHPIGARQTAPLII